MEKRLTEMIKIAVFFVFVCFFSLSAAAEAIAPDFTVYPILPDNQKEAVTGYFDLVISPDTQQTIQLVVTNESKEDKTLSIKAVSASTSPFGVLDYTTEEVRDESMKHPFSEIAKVPEERITVPKNSTEVIEVHLVTPKDPFEGLILGSVVVTDLTTRLALEQQEKTNEQTKMSIYNEFEYAIAVVLQENEKTVSPNFALGNVYTTMRDNQEILVAEIRNTEAYLAKDFFYTATVTAIGAEESTFSVSDVQVSLAPNSTMAYEFRTEMGKKLAPGQYQVETTLRNDAKEWSFSQEITINQQGEIDGAQTTAVQQQGSRVSNNLPLVLGFMALLLVVLFFFLLRRKKQKSK